MRTGVRPHFYSFLKNPLPPGGFARNVLTMMMGTTISQAISIAVAPVLTRIYKPEDYGIFALYISFVSIIGIVVTGRYDLAVMLPEKDEDAINIMALAMIITFLISFVTLIVIWLFNNPIAKSLGNLGIGKWFYLLPLSVFLTGFYNIFSYWSNRKRQYRRLSFNKILSSSTTSSINIAMGYLRFGPSGLVFGGIAGQSIAISVLGWQIWREDKDKLEYVRNERIIQQANRFRRFPVYALPADFVNIASQQAPIFLLTNFFGSTIVGFFSLTQRVLGVPFDLVGQSILAVFRERASIDYNVSGNCKGIYIKTFKSLLLISILPFVLLVFAAPSLFSFIFGSEWRVAGEYAQILSPLFLFRFISSPLSYVFYIAEKQDYDLCGQILLFIFSVGSFTIGNILNSPKIGIICFSLSYSFVYCLFLIGSYYLSSGHTNNKVKGHCTDLKK